MAAERDDNSHLGDILTATCAVESFVQGRTDADYLADLMLRSAVERQIEIIGEAARHVSAAFQAAHPEIPWRLDIREQLSFLPRVTKGRARIHEKMLHPLCKRRRCPSTGGLGTHPARIGIA